MNKETSLTVPEDALRVVRDYVPLLRELSDGPHAVVCGPVHDSSSDLDFGVLVTGTDPLSSDKAPVWDRIGERTAYWTSKGYVIDGPGAGRTEDVDQDLQDVLDGVIKASRRPYRIREHYNYVAIGSLARSVSVEDPFRIAASWRERLSVYPQKLKDAIIKRFRASLERWPNDHHYVRAIHRADLVLTTGVVQRVLHDWFHVIFALNEAWHSGDKHILSSLERLSEVPDRCTQKVEYLLWPPKTASALAAQREVLVELAAFTLSRADCGRGSSTAINCEQPMRRPRD